MQFYACFASNNIICTGVNVWLAIWFYARFKTGTQCANNERRKGHDGNALR